MKKSIKSVAIHTEILKNKIYLIRNTKVMLDRDLAELYNVETKRLKEAVRRNIERFPEDFMFEMTKDEFLNWRTQIASSNSEMMGLRYAPFCFTEQGIAMISSVLNNSRAIQVNIQIIRVFTKMRELLLSHKEILKKLKQIENKDIEQDEKIILIFKYIEQLEKTKQEELKYRNRRKLGFKTSEDNP
ncbi:MAG: ORF6N domain-containing protein [Bacteroidales bacterium]|nr:ORF6N domain-containing protein [Bacteroidales bacterium]